MIETLKAFLFTKRLKKRTVDDNGWPTDDEVVRMANEKWKWKREGEKVVSTTFFVAAVVVVGTSISADH